MKAIVISRFGGPEVLELRDRQAPPPGRGEVRVRIRAAAVNRADLLQRAGHYPAPPDATPDVPGLEFAGELEALGDGVTGAAPGQRVLGLCGGGAYAEAITVPARTVAPLPDALTFTDGAAIPEAFITAWDALIEQARLRAGETVLIHAAGSGVGTAAVQVAHAIGARVVGTARTADKLARARPLGLDEGVHVEGGGGFAPAVLHATEGRGADVVLDLVGGPYLAESLACVAPRARIMLVGLLAGPRAELDLGRLLQRRVQLTGTVLRARPLEEKIAAVQQMARHLMPLFERGALRPVVDRVFPLAEAGAAHAHVASNGGFGKVVLAVS
ncbi:MAG TPA: NAD(P)H-quinone oxidoreductase [Polyangia bacterium]|nr:NAD(P)H-quinone oxidoreductase [Polyangia bacterium]